MASARNQRYLEALQFAERQVAATAERHPDFFPIYTRGASGTTAASCGPIGPAASSPA